MSINHQSVNQKTLVVAHDPVVQVKYRSPIETIEAVELIIEQEEELRKAHRQIVLEIIYEMDPLIKQAAEKLQRLSEEPDVVEQYHRREAELAQRRLQLERNDAEEDN